MENNFDTKNEIQNPSYVLPSNRKNKLVAPLIIVIILAIAGIAFGIFEFISNASLKSEIEDLEAKISTLENPKKPETPGEKPYSGMLEYEYKGGDATTETTSKVTLNYDTGELSVASTFCGGTAYECITEESTITLTDKELIKVWLITIADDYDKATLTEALNNIAISENYSNHQYNEPVDCANVKEAETDCIATVIDYRATGNSLLDDMLFEIYGYINCMPTSCDSEEECLSVEIVEGLTCDIAEKIDYPYIVY